MLQRIRLQTPDGEVEYIYAPDSKAYDAGRASGEIAPGMDIVYRRWIAYVLDNGAMIIPAESFAHPLQIAPPIFNMGGMAGMCGGPNNPLQFTGGMNDT